MSKADYTAVPLTDEQKWVKKRARQVMQEWGLNSMPGGAEREATWLKAREIARQEWSALAQAQVLEVSDES